MTNQVVITGVGAVTVHGDLESTCRTIARGERLNIGDGHKSGDRPAPDEGCDPATRLALAAADAAMRHAGLTRTICAERRGAVLLGSSRSTEWSREAVARRIATGDKPHGHECGRTMIAAPAAEISRRYGVRGLTAVLSATCTSAAQSLFLGTHLIRCGVLDFVICGGVESCLTPTYVHQLSSAGLLATARSLPFDATSQGMHVSSGAGVFVLEQPHSAAGRSGRMVGYLLGVSVESDAASSPRGPTHVTIARSVHAALDEAHLKPDDIGFIVSHGSGIPQADSEELQALRAVFGVCRPAIPLLSLKPFVGHTVGASAAVELALALTGTSSGLLPPCDALVPALGGLERYPCNARHHPNQRPLLKLACGLGGMCAAIVAAVPNSTR